MSEHVETARLLWEIYLHLQAQTSEASHDDVLNVAKALTAELLNEAKDISHDSAP